MPIYAYRCADCGHTKDVLRKISDPPLVTCPACGAESFEKQLTAAGFQLKGSGWYVTDFRNKDNAGAKKGGGDAAAKPAGDAPAPAPAADGGSSSSGGGGESGGSSGTSAAAACGGSCACH